MDVRACVMGASMAVVLVLSAGGCSRDDGPPTHLVDGSPAEGPTVALDAPKPQIATKASAVLASRARRSVAGRCVAMSHDDPAHDAAVVRIGTTGSSVTFRTESSHALISCDGGVRGKSTAPSFCGRAYGRLQDGRLRDPRLDLAGCTTAGGETVAFAWFQPGPQTSFVAVRQPGYVEVYPVVGRAPVRISTTANISTRESQATFMVSEHNAKGALLLTSTLEARAAG